MRLGAALAAAVVGLAGPACSQPPPQPARTQMASAPVTLSRETPRREIPVPAGPAAPKALAVRLDPAAGAPGMGVIVWLVEPGGARTRLGAVSPFPVGEPGEFLIPWPPGRPAPAAGSRLELELAAPGEGRPTARVSVGWR